MKCQSLFSEKNKKKYFKMSSAEIFNPACTALTIQNILYKIANLNSKTERSIDTSIIQFMISLGLEIRKIQTHGTQLL